jgi:hypothetical protein
MLSLELGFGLAWRRPKSESGHVLTEKGEQLFRDALSRHQE